MDKISTDVLVVGGGTGGIAAAIQAARYGVKTILATEFSWLGGMLTSTIRLENITSVMRSPCLRTDKGLPRLITFNVSNSLIQSAKIPAPTAG